MLDKFSFSTFLNKGRVQRTITSRLKFEIYVYFRKINNFNS